MAKNNPALEGAYKFTRPGASVFELFIIRFADYDTGAIDAEIKSGGLTDSVSSAGYKRNATSNTTTRTDLSFTRWGNKYHLWTMDLACNSFTASIQDSSGNWSEEFTFTKL